MIIPLPSTAPDAPPGGRKLILSTDPRIINAAIDRLITHSGQRSVELARLLGVKRQSLEQYVIGRRSNPSISWLSRLAEVCNARVIVEFL